MPAAVSGALRSPGQALDMATRAYMEPRFGYDFSKVRVHTDASAAKGASSINAKAFASNSDVVFGAGEYAPHTATGRLCLAHELTHVVQQHSGAMLKSGIGDATDAYERQADTVARTVASGRSTASMLDSASQRATQPQANTIQRQTTEKDGGDPKSLTHAALLEDPATGELTSPTIDGKTLDERIQQIHTLYDKYFVLYATDCLKATKAALDKMGLNVGASDANFIKGEIGDKGLSDAENTKMLAALRAEVESGHPVVVGVNYQAGSPNADKITDHFLYIVASTVDDSGQPIMVGYENVGGVAGSKVIDGNIVLFRMNELGRLYHEAYFSKGSTFSTSPHIVANFRPTTRKPKPKSKK